jgi:pimeloyl-ACP methyl ester carboxylesterase
MTTATASQPVTAAHFDAGREILFAKTPQGNVEYTLTGEGHMTVLALHGAMGGHDQAELLGRTVGDPQFRYLSVSRPGYLGTPLSVGKTPEEQADAYAALLDALEIQKVAVIAISGGGPSAIHFALRHRDRCRCLVLISTCGQRVTERLPVGFYMLKFLGRWPGLLRGIRGKGMQDLEGFLRRSVSDPDILARTLHDPEVRPLLEEMMRMSSDRISERLPGTFNDVTTTRTCDYPLEQIAVPTLVVHGAADKFVPFEQHGKILASRIPGAELVAVEGGEHVTIFTHRDIVRPRVVEFIRASANAE